MEALSEERMSATNCVHMQDELVNTCPTWQIYKDSVFITCSWNILPKWTNDFDLKLGFKELKKKNKKLFQYHLPKKQR